jgi:hypothetical protein
MVVCCKHRLSYGRRKKLKVTNEERFNKMQGCQIMGIFPFAYGVTVHVHIALGKVNGVLLPGEGLIKKNIVLPRITEKPTLYTSRLVI